MAIRFTGQRYFYTNNTDKIVTNRYRTSISFKFRYEVDPAGAASCYMFANSAGQTFSFVLGGEGSQSNTIKLSSNIMSSGGYSAHDSFNLAVGSDYHLALTYDQGLQNFWINGVPNGLDNLDGPTKYSNTPIFFGLPVAWNPDTSLVLDDIAIWNDYILTENDIANLRDGVKTPASIGISGKVYWWTLAGPSGTKALLGDSGLNNNLGNSSANFTNVVGTGTAIYVPAIKWKPSIFLDKAYCTTGGQSIVMFFKGASGQTAIPQKLVRTPTLYKNGINVGQLICSGITGYHSCLFCNFPSGVSANNKDILTISASGSWIITDLGAVIDINNYPVRNNVNKSCFGTEIAEKKLRIGLNFPHLGTYSSCMYQVTKNWMFRSNIFQGILDNSFKPISMAVQEESASLWNFDFSNGLDLLSLPGPTGLWSVGFDELNLSNPTTFTLGSPITTETIVPERLDMKNIGINGSGQVRVFEVKKPSGSNTAAVYVNVYMYNANLSPKFNNLVVYGPGDFTCKSGVPTVLDRSDPYAFSSIFLEKTDGIGSARWVDSTLEFDGASAMVDPKEMHQLSDFTWGIGSLKQKRSIDHIMARPFVISPSSYIYSPVFSGGKFLITSLQQLCIQNNLVTEFVTKEPHGLQTGKVVYFNGFPSLLYNDGTNIALNGLYRTVFVTGPNSYVFSIFSSQSSSATLASGTVFNPPVSLNYFTPGVGFPIEIPAKATGRIPGCDFHVNIPYAASDAFVREWARKIRDNYPVGRNIWLELCNETWDFFTQPYIYFTTMSHLLYPNGMGREFYIIRAHQVRNIFIEVFNEGGRNRGREIKLGIGVQTTIPSMTNIALTFAAANGIKVDAIYIAPYLNADSSDEMINMFSICNTQQAIDLFIHDMYYNTREWPSIFQQHRNYINIYNKATGNKCVLYGYEGGVQYPNPYSYVVARDMVYDPNWGIIEKDIYKFWQDNGMYRENLYNYCSTYVNQTVYPVYHTHLQKHGYGKNNRSCLAQTKPANVSLDENESVRGQALLDWNKEVALRQRRKSKCFGRSRIQ